MKEEKEVLYRLELAEQALKEHKASLAQEHLRSIQFDIDQFKERSPWAKYSFILAGSFALVGDPAADAHFEDAVQRASNLIERDSQLEMRIHADYGCYLDTFKHKRSVARQHHEAAMKLAIVLRLPEHKARYHLRIIQIDLNADGDPLILDFQSLRNAAKLHSCTAVQELAGWMKYCEEDGGRPASRIAARTVRTVKKPGDDRARVEFFSGLLISMKNSEL